MSKIVYSKNAPDALGPYSQAIISGGFVFTAGQLGINPATGELASTIEEQTEQIMNNLNAVLSEAGTSFEKAVKTTCFLSDMNDFVAFNGVYGKYFTGKPARSCFAVKQLPKNALVEVEVIAEV